MAKKKKEQSKNVENKSNEEIFENEFLSMPQLVWRILKSDYNSFISIDIP